MKWCSKKKKSSSARHVILMYSEKLKELTMAHSVLIHTNPRHIQPTHINVMCMNISRAVAHSRRIKRKIRKYCAVEGWETVCVACTITIYLIWLTRYVYVCSRDILGQNEMYCCMIAEAYINTNISVSIPNQPTYKTKTIMVSTYYRILHNVF